MILWPETQAGYVSAFLTKALGVNAESIRVESMYPFKKYHRSLLERLPNFSEGCFLFFLENFYHSSIFCDRYVSSIFTSAEASFKEKEVIVHSSKMDAPSARSFMERFPFVKTVVRTDIEYYLLERFGRNKKDSEIANVTYRDDGQILDSPSTEVDYDLSECVFPAYEDGVILREKDNYYQIVAFLDDDTGEEDNKYYYRKTRSAFIRQLDSAFAKKKALITTGR